MAGIVIRPRSRIFHGHDWVYSSEIQKVFGEPKNGDVISIKDGRDRMLGSAIYNSKSQIAARRFCRQRQDLDADFFERRIRQAIEYRKRRGVNIEVCRLIWSESDGLPGVIVDRYKNTLVLQTLTLAMDQRKQLLVDALTGILAPEAIVERNDAPIRRAEGMEPRTECLLGNPAPVEIELLGLRFLIDPLHGQKTGFYLDQVDSYDHVGQWANGRRVLDCFSNQGAFALSCAKNGATEVSAVEISTEAVSQIKANAQRNQLQVNAMEANAFDFLNQAERDGSQYDLIVLDPPSFTKSKDKLHDAMRGYKEIHLRALKILSKEGLLATFSCSHHVSDTLFRQMIGEALVDAKKSARQLAIFRQSADHPIMLNLPETEYLKGYLLEMAPGR